jgi:hypothetical protein
MSLALARRRRVIVGVHRGGVCAMSGQNSGLGRIAPPDAGAIFPRGHLRPSHEGTAEAAGIPIADSGADLRNAQLVRSQKRLRGFLAHFVHEFRVTDAQQREMPLKRSSTDLELGRDSREGCAPVLKGVRDRALQIGPRNAMLRRSHANLCRRARTPRRLSKEVVKRKNVANRKFQPRTNPYNRETPPAK